MSVRPAITHRLKPRRHRSSHFPRPHAAVYYAFTVRRTHPFATFAAPTMTAMAKIVRHASNVSSRPTVAPAASCGSPTFWSARCAPRFAKAAKHATSARGPKPPAEADFVVRRFKAWAICVARKCVYVKMGSGLSTRLPRPAPLRRPVATNEHPFDIARDESRSPIGPQSPRV